MFKYLLGFVKNLFNPAVSKFAVVDFFSSVDTKAKVYRSAKLFHSSLGKYSYIGKRSSLAFVEVGAYCSIASDVCIGLGQHDIKKLSTSPLFTQKHNGTGHTWTDLKPLLFEKVIIGNDVWIGERAVVKGGVTIGSGAVIGAGAIVTKDVPPYAIVAGVPARLLRYRFSKDIIDYLEDLKWWDLPENVLKENIDVFQSGDVTINIIKKIKIQ